MRLERIGEDSALIARIEAINVAAFPEIERISIKNFLKMSRKGQLEIAAIFEDFSALNTDGATGKNRAAASKNLCAPKQDFCAAKRDCGEASQDRDAAGKNYDADNCSAAELASLSFENRGAADKKSNATYEKSSLKSKNSSAASEHSSAAAHNLSGEDLVGFCVYRTEQTYKRAISHHKQPPPRLNADKILRSKAHSGADDEIPGGEIKFSEAEFSNDTIGKIASQKTQPFSGDEILNASADSKIPIDEDRLICGASGKISSSVGRDEISSSASESKISSIASESEISRYDESEISSGGESEIFYVAYLGIDAKFRGLGIGSRLLALIVTQNPSAQIVLDVEPPHEDAPNLAQRLRRIEFYGRHGFRRCGKFFNYAGLSFEILFKLRADGAASRVTKGVAGDTTDEVANGAASEVVDDAFDAAAFAKFIGAGNKFRFKITDAPLYKN